MAIPLIWIPLDKQGNSSVTERTDLLTRLFRLIPRERIRYVVADREFIGKTWFAWLREHNIAFHIRIKHNALTTDDKGLETTSGALFYKLRPGKRRRLRGARMIYENPVFLTGSKLNSGELMIIASSHQDASCAVEAYQERLEAADSFVERGCRSGKIPEIFTMVNFVVYREIYRIQRGHPGPGPV